MITSIKMYPIIKGVRGEKGLNIQSIIDVILRISKLVQNHPEILELDLNPVMAFENSVAVVDARIKI
jgi:acetyltransferase